MEKTYGFITVATGNELYYQIALNLLRSYRQFSAEPLPFAILADQENVYTAEFDDVILLEHPTRSYLDKLEMFNYLPYDVNIFIDADCLAYDDLNVFFDYFEQADDFSCGGRVLTLDDKTGWFEYENLGSLRSEVDYVVGLHGGIYYMRRTEACRRIFEGAKRFSKNYADYEFKGKFSTPGDEPLIALSMAVNHMKPITMPAEAMTVFWEHEHDMQLNMTYGKAKIRSEQQSIRLLHWGTRFCKTPLYQKQVAQLNLLHRGAGPLERMASNIKYDRMQAKERTLYLANRVKEKIKRTLLGKK